MAPEVCLQLLCMPTKRACPDETIQTLNPADQYLYPAEKSELFKMENQKIYLYPMSNLTTRLRRQQLLIELCSV